MKITELPAYERLEEMFEKKGYSLGNEREIFDEVEDVSEYIKAHPEKFSKQFYKDHLATDEYGFEDFEYMPLEFIDEEMVVCAMLETVNVCMFYGGARDDCEDWFYSVYRRKPEVLTEDLYILGARCFAKKVNGRNRFLDITPEKYRTREFYMALCFENNTPVMEDIPERILTKRFLMRLLNDNTENIRCFSEAALERETSMPGVKFWQAAVVDNGCRIRDIPLNDERVEFFLSKYDKDSFEYEFGFKEHYRRYLRKKNAVSENE